MKDKNKKDIEESLKPVKYWVFLAALLALGVVIGLVIGGNTSGGESLFSSMRGEEVTVPMEWLFFTFLLLLIWKD